jgi:uncharacterized membrane protein
MVSQWKPKTLDLALSILLALLFPFLAQFLYTVTGALIPLLIYYGIAWGVSKWRRGSTGYFNEFTKKYPRSFFINVGVIILSLIFAFLAQIVSSSTVIGILLTALIWAPINALSEQLLWIYIFEAWDLYIPWTKENKKKNWIYRIIGLIFFSVFVGMIHTLFWMNFLHTVDSNMFFGILFILMTSLSGYIHLWVWRESNQMVFTFIPHFLLNLIPLFWTGYSILPYLWN